MCVTEYRTEEFSSNENDPTGDWEAYLHNRQGAVGLTFPDRSFRSGASARNVGRLQVVRFSTGAMDYRRSARHIRRDGDEHSHRLLVPLKGRFRFEQGESREMFRPGKVGFFHWNRPLFMSHSESISALILTVPEGAVDADRAAKAPLLLDETRPLVAGLVRQVRWLSEAEGWSAADFTVAYQGVIAQIDGALNPYPAITTGPLAEQAQRARALLEERAHDANLEVADIATELGISLRTLYRAFEEADFPAPSEMLRSIRLERAHRRLCVALPIDLSDLAHQMGFSSLRRFREAYQNRYGLTPAAYRQQLFGDVSVQSEDFELRS